MYRRIINALRILIHLPKSLYFNFHYLPFKQAIKIPVVFYSKVNLLALKGTLEIKGELSFRSIKIGDVVNPLFPKTFPFVWNNNGGRVVLKNGLRIASGCVLEIGEGAYLELGRGIIVMNTKIVCHNKVIIKDELRISWETLIMDTDWHNLYYFKKENINVKTKPIIIGKHNWIGCRCNIIKGTNTPDYTVVGSNSLLNKKYSIPEFSILAGNPAKFIKEGVYRVIDEKNMTEEIAKIKLLYNEKN